MGLFFVDSSCATVVLLKPSLLVGRCAFRLYDCTLSHAHHLHHLGVVSVPSTGWPQKTVSWRRSEPSRLVRIVERWNFTGKLNSRFVIWDVVDSINCTNKCALLYLSCHFYMVGYAALIIYTRYVFVFAFFWMNVCTINPFPKPSGYDLLSSSMNIIKQAKLVR